MNSELSDQVKVTVALLAYQQIGIIDEAVDSVFSLIYPDLDIILLDDGSTDGTAERLLARADAYLHSFPSSNAVRVIVNDENHGISAQVALAADLARGGLLVLCSGDDVQCPQRVMRIVERWETLGRQAYTSFHSSFRWRHDPTSRAQDATVVQGRLPPELFIARRYHVNGCTSAYTLDLFRDFPPLITGGMRDDDVVPLRSLLMSASIEYIDEPLAILRLGGISSSTMPDAASMPHVHCRRSWNLIARAQNLVDTAYAPMPHRRRISLIGLATLGVIAEIPLDFWKPLAMRNELRCVIAVVFLPMFVGARLIHMIFMRFYLSPLP